jgi:hypothetical protein
VTAAAAVDATVAAAAAAAAGLHAPDLLGDSIFGDLCCIMVGLIIVLGIRLSGTKVSSSFWPPS